MPFDSLVHADIKDTLAPTNTLAAIGLRPVLREMAEAHKAKMLQTFASKGQLNARLVGSGLARWRMYPVSAHKHASQTYAQYVTFLTRFEESGPTLQPPATPPPPAVAAMMDEVNAGVERATFEIEYFDKDPIVNVRYRDSFGNLHEDCLAIWDGATLIAIASRESPKYLR